MQRLLLLTVNLVIGLCGFQNSYCMVEKPLITVKEYYESEEKRLKQSNILRRIKIELLKANDYESLIEPLKKLLLLTKSVSQKIDWDISDTETNYLMKYYNPNYSISNANIDAQVVNLWLYQCNLAWLSLSEQPEDFIQAIEVFMVWDTDIGSIKAAQFLHNWENSTVIDKLQPKFDTIKAVAINHSEVLSNVPLPKSLVDLLYQTLGHQTQI